MTNLKRRRILQTAALLAASTGLAACQGEPSAETRAPTGAPDAPTTPPLQPTATLQPAEPPAQQATPETHGELPPLALLVVHRLQFGPAPGDWEAFEALGMNDDERLQVFLDMQLDPDRIDDSEFEQRFYSAGFETLDKSLETLASEHIVNNPYDDNDERHWQWYSKPVDELMEATFLRAVYSKRQLQELLVDFWHNHFNIYAWQDDVAPLLPSYDRDVIRRHALGNFREMLEAVATHPSMLFYLDNRSNSDGGPNENFARELFELYTLGAENYLGVHDPTSVAVDENGLAVGYVDNDVYEAARCFTGWRVDDDLWDGENEIGDTLSFRYYRAWHDRYNKLVLGRYLPADQADQQDGRDVLDLLARHPGTAHFIAGKLCRRFVSDTPPTSLVDVAASVFLNNSGAPDQLAQVVRAILSSAEFRQAWRGKNKRPFEWAVAALRGLQADFTRLPGGVRWTYDMMGQALFGHHPPDGYADTAGVWANTMVTLYGWNLINGLTRNWWSEEAEGGSLKTDVWANTPAGLDTPEAAVDAWLERLQLVDFPAESRQAVVDFLAGGSPAERSDRLPGAVALIMMSPDFRCR